MLPTRSSTRRAEKPRATRRGRLILRGASAARSEALARGTPGSATTNFSPRLRTEHVQGGDTPKLARSHRLSSSKPIALDVPKALATWPSRPSRTQARNMHLMQSPKSPSAENRTAVSPHSSAPMVRIEGAAHLKA
eukprot:1997404-Rhodomonas_salina.1